MGKVEKRRGKNYASTSQNLHCHIPFREENRASFREAEGKEREGA